MQRSSSKSRIYWSPSEWQRLAAAAAPFVLGGLSPLDAFRRVQAQVFNAEQWRIRILDSEASVAMGMPTLLAQVQSLGGMPVVAPPPVAAPPPAPTELPPWMLAAAEAEADRQAAALRAKYDEAVAARVREKLQAAAAPVAAPAAGTLSLPAKAAQPEPVAAAAPAQKVEQQQRDQAAPVRRRHDPQPQIETTRLPRVVIMGCWPNLRAHLEQEFKGVLDLRFFDPDQNESVVIERVARGSAIAFSIDGIGGRMPALLKSAAPRYEVIHGSQTRMTERLTRFAVEKR